METNEIRRPLVEQLVRGYKNKRMTLDELYTKAAAWGFDKEAVDSMIPPDKKDA